MADEKWRAIRDLIRELTSDTRKADFFQLVRLFERARCTPGLLPPGGQLKRPPGTSRRLSDEAIRFHARISARFVVGATGSLDQAFREAGEDPTRVETSFASAAGAQGILPSHYTTLILERLREGDTALRDYLDVFHHRIISALVRGWEKHRPYAILESGGHPVIGERDEDGMLDVFSNSVSAIAGRRRYDAPAGFDENIFLYYSGIFSDCRRSATSLSAMLEEHFRIPVAIEQFYPIRIRVPDDVRWQLDTRPNGRGPLLGSGLLLGESTEVVQTSIRVRIGPVRLDQFRDYLPEGDRFAPFSRLMRYYAGFEFTISVQLLLDARDVPEFRLGGTQGVRLGWETWMYSRSPEVEVLDDVAFMIGT